MVKKNYLTTVLLLFNTFIMIHAQRLYCGTVMNSEGNPIEFANVALFSPEDSTFIEGVFTGHDGKFSLNTTSKGIIKVSCIGYDSEIIDATKNNISVIILKEEYIPLQEVVVYSSKPITRFEGDALVTNVKGTILEKSGTAKDVLGFLPGVINNQGNIEVFGKGTPLFYINGRLVRDNKMIEQVSASKIKKVEVVMNPGSRYSATAKSVIRIVSEKETGEGFSIDFSTKQGLSDYFYNSEITSLNYHNKKLEVFTNLEYDRNKTKTLSYLEQTAWLSSKNVQDINMHTKESQPLYDGQLGFSYTFSPEQSMGLFYKVTHKRKENRSQISTQAWIDDILEENGNTNYNSSSNNTSHLIDGYYYGNIKKWKVEATLNILWRRINGNAQSLESSSVMDSRTVSIMDKIRSHMVAGELHLSRSLWKGFFQFGAEHTNSLHDESEYYKENFLESKNPITKEKNSALYIEYSKKVGKMVLRLGSRYEHTKSDYFISNNKINEQCRTYDKLFPTLMITAQLGKAFMQWGYSKKYKRPLYSQLSNTITYVNRYLIEGGNPSLRPTYTDNITLNLKYGWAMLLFNFDHIKDKIISHATQYEDCPNVTLLKKDNSEYKLNELQLMLSLSPTLKKYYPALNIGLLAPFYKERNRDGIKHFNHPIYIIKFSNMLTLTNTSFLNAELFYRSKGNGENLYIEKTWHVNIGVTKVLGKHWNIKLAAYDIFNTNRKNISTMYCDLRDSYMKKTINARKIECTIRYIFNSTKSNYKGKGAGNTEKGRLE